MRLFRGHILRRAQQLAAAEGGAAGHHGAAQDLDQAKIGEDGAVVGGKENILRLDVAVHHAGGVGVVQGVGHGLQQGQGNGQVVGAVLRQPGSQVAAGQVFHHQVKLPPFLAHVVDVDDVRVA